MKKRDWIYLRAVGVGKRVRVQSDLLSVQVKD